MTTPTSSSLFRDFKCGSGAAMINVVVTFPLHKTIFRQQVTGDSALSTIRQLYLEGPFYLYRGFLLIHRTMTLSVMFGSQQNFRHLFDPHLSFNLSIWVSGMLAGATEAALTPLERVLTLLQAPPTQHKMRSTFSAFNTIYDEYGVREYYRGFTPILIRNSFGTAIFFSLRTPLKSRLPEAKNQVQDSINDFISGALLGAMISTLFYPFNVIRSNMQLQLGGPFQSVAASFDLVYKQRGSSIRKFFRGVHLNFTRSLISWGIINCSFEWLKRFYDQKSQFKE